MTTPIRPSEFSLVEVRQALQKIELNRRTGVQHNLNAVVDPAEDGSDDETKGYSASSFWFNATEDKLFLCGDATKDNALWVNLFGPLEVAGTGFSWGFIEPPDANTLTASEKGDTLTFVATGGITITGDSALDELTFDGASSSYTPAVPDDWEDTDPTTPGGALDRIAGGHAGVCLISDTEPTTPGNGQLWLDTDATGAAGSGVLTVNTITADTTLTSSHTAVLCDASTGAITVTLPAASANAGRRYFIKKIDSTAFTVTIDGNAFETIDGDLTAIVRSQYEAVLIVCDGSNWHLL